MKITPQLAVKLLNAYKNDSYKITQKLLYRNSQILIIFSE